MPNKFYLDFCSQFNITHHLGQVQIIKQIPIQKSQNIGKAQNHLSSTNKVNWLFIMPN